MYIHIYIYIYTYIYIYIERERERFIHLSKRAPPMQTPLETRIEGWSTAG